MEIERHLRKVAEAEGFEMDEKALDLIGRVAEGSMRDGISLLDQLVSFCGHKIGYDDVVMLLGTADEELLFGFGETLVSGDISGLLELIRKGIEEGRSMLQVTRDLVSHFRNLLHLKVGSGEALELTSDYLQRLKIQAEKYSLEKLKEIIRALSRAELDMKWHPHSRLVLEVSLLELLEREKPVKVESVNTGEYQSIRIPACRQAWSEREDQKIRKSEDQTLSKIKSHWEEILEAVKRKSPFSYVSLQEGQPLEINGKGKLVVGFRRGYSFHKERLEDQKNKEVVEESVREATGSSIPIECLIVDNLPKEHALSLDYVRKFFS